ncbi:MAG: M15 family metallopeptidase [Ruminococcus sp.]|nr:M15 family metallopeptidase [Ruminococcus sp.]
MPYKRYDIKNKYNRRGRRVNEVMGMKIFFLIFLPILIIGVILLGIFIPYKSTLNSRPSLPVPATANESVAQQEEDLLLIVNDTYPLDSNYKPSLVPFGSIKVAKIAFDDLDDLISAAAGDGVSLTVTAGYISYDEQAKLYEETFARLKKENNYSEIKAESETKRICPVAGCSESQTGLLITFSTDEKGDFAKTKAGKWLLDNSIDFGFVLRYPEDEEESTGRRYEAAVYRYVGRDNALKMRAYDMTFERFSVHVNSK